MPQQAPRSEGFLAGGRRIDAPSSYSSDISASLFAGAFSSKALWFPIVLRANSSQRCDGPIARVSTHRRRHRRGEDTRKGNGRSCDRVEHSHMNEQPFWRCGDHRLPKMQRSPSFTRSRGRGEEFWPVASYGKEPWLALPQIPGPCLRTHLRQDLAYIRRQLQVGLSQIAGRAFHLLFTARPVAGEVGVAAVCMGRYLATTSQLHRQFGPINCRSWTRPHGVA